MGRKIVVLVIVSTMLVLVVAGCGQDPKTQYAEKASRIVERWQAIVAQWNAKPGDPKVATEFAKLQGDAKAIKPPENMKNLHGLLLQAIETEAKSFEAYATGNKRQSALLHAMALDTMQKYKKALQNLGLVK